MSVRTLSLRGRLAGCLLALTAIAFAGALALAVVRTRSAVEAEMAASAALALALIEDGSQCAVASPGESGAYLERLRTLGRHRHLYIDLAGPDAPAPVLAQPEVPGWFVQAVAVQAPRFERALDFAPPQPDMRLRVFADPADELEEAWSDFRALLWLFGSFALLVNAVAFRLAGRVAAPITMLEARLDAIAAGEYGPRTGAAGLPELDRLGQRIDRLADCLAASHAENRRLAAHALTVREAERRWLAAELHDELGQSLTAIQADTATIRHLAGSEAVDACAEAIAVNTGAIQLLLRSLIHRLHPMALEVLGLRVALLQMCADRGTRAADAPVTLDWDERLPERPDCGIHAYRIVQEALTNVTRHAAARTVQVRLHRDGDWLVLQVRDDGRGFEPQRQQQGFGLAGLRERAQLLGGELVIVAAPGAGVDVRARLPLHIEAQAPADAGMTPEP